MRKKGFIFGLMVLFVAVSTAMVADENPLKSSTQKMPDDVKAIIQKSCFGCHNTDSKNEDAREDLDFKKLDGLSKIKKISAYKHIIEVVEENEMPPKKMVEKKPGIKLSEKEKTTLIAWAKKEAETLVKEK